METGKKYSGRVTTEGDELYYEVRGQGQPILMISAAGGVGNIIHLLQKFLQMNLRS